MVSDIKLVHKRWETQNQIKEELEVQFTHAPITHQCRILIKEPTLSSIPEALQKLKDSGVPDNASISFQQWNAPNTNYYIIGTWEE